MLPTMVPLGPHPLSIWTPNYEAMNQIPPAPGSGSDRDRGGGKGEQKGRQSMKRRKEGRAIHLRNGKRKGNETLDGNGSTEHLTK